MPLTDKEQLLNEAEYHLKNNYYGDQGGCHPPRPTALSDDNLLHLHTV